MRKVHETYPLLKIIVYSMFFSPNVMKQAINSGALGYISKNAKSEELLNCLETVANGSSYLEKSLIQNYMQNLIHYKNGV